MRTAALKFGLKCAKPLVDFGMNLLANTREHLAKGHIKNRFVCKRSQQGRQDVHPFVARNLRFILDADDHRKLPLSQPDTLAVGAQVRSELLLIHADRYGLVDLCSYAN